MKRTLFILLFFCVSVFSQTHLKGNVTSLFGLPQFGVETKIFKNVTFQVDVLGSLWKSINNAPQQFIIVTPEIRYHFNTLEKGFYVGVHIAGSKYKMQKWNYINTDYYQVGYSVLYGGTLGIKVPINERFALDVFLGGGLQNGFYKGYLISTGERYEDALKFNKSGEFLPYRGGVMISYKL